MLLCYIHSLVLFELLAELDDLLCGFSDGTSNKCNDALPLIAILSVLQCKLGKQERKKGRRRRQKEWRRGAMMKENVKAQLGSSNREISVLP
jgi:hypothetical protein